MKLTDIDKFIYYLELEGVEVLPNTDRNTIVTFTVNNVVHKILERPDRTIYFDSKESAQIFTAFKNNKHLKKKNAKRDRTVKLRQQLLKRDGNKCFYTGKEMKPEDITLEHLVPLSKGGKNNLHNLVLCCKEENIKMGNKMLVEKILYREQNLFVCNK